MWTSFSLEKEDVWIVIQTLAVTSSGRRSVSTGSAKAHRGELGIANDDRSSHFI
jgi:hypothetical protein